MGMVIDGHWQEDTDRFMQDGVFQREPSPLPSAAPDEMAAALQSGSATLIASASCPWSHATVLARAFKGLNDSLPPQIAGGPRVEGYGLHPDGPLATRLGLRHAHQLYTLTDPYFTGRSTVPILWHNGSSRILSNSSADILIALNQAGNGPDLYPATLHPEIDVMIAENFTQLANAVYRAGLAERQAGYDEAVDAVFARMHWLDTHLAGRPALIGTSLTFADLRLFACLVRFDTVYATHFRCTRHRLTDFPHLWRYTRAIYQMPQVQNTVDFDEIRRGYYLNDGDHNPHGIVADEPHINWMGPV